MGDQLQRQLRQLRQRKSGNGASSPIAFGPAILVEEPPEEEEEVVSSLRRSSSRSESEDEEEERSRLAQLRQKGLVRELRMELLDTKRRHRSLAEELVKRGW